MKDGFVRVAAGTPAIVLTDTEANADEVIRLMKEAAAARAKVLALSELCLTGYTAGDLFFQRTLQEGALAALAKVVKASRGLDILAFVGLPLTAFGRLYNCAAAVHNGALLGVVPKRHLPNYGEFHELRHFANGEGEAREIELLGQTVPFGGDVLFACEEMPELVVGCEICEDMWVPVPPSAGHAMAGASVIVNLSASSEIVGKASYRELMLKSQSARLMCAYVYADAGDGESVTDLVFAGHNLIAENGAILASSKRHECGLVTADVDVGFLMSERGRRNTFGACAGTHTRVKFHLKPESPALLRFVDPQPFVPAGLGARARRCEDILDIQTHALASRMKSIGAKTAVLGVSGGLDSTLALIVATRALSALGLNARNLLAVTMPCFGTTERTLGNARALAKGLDATLYEINIRQAVAQHLADIGHDLDLHDVAYENAQARERTQVLMDLANQRGGLVVGTGDLSELALGWATYNGDHMSMYAVNAGVPKTLVRHLVRFAADTAEDEALRAALTDVLETPISPELLPPKDGAISQATEDILGPYALHDFFLYHLVRRMESPRKIARLARVAFEGEYTADVIDKWLGVFLKRFFAQQFKRSCLPDGPKIGSVSLSPRGDWRMPSDAVGKIWLKFKQNDV
ncbi:MAG: NAD(+) synthase [Christensenellaceae bacterium]|nr:NAD(+) synthase [Christensenellaceae bacterium]